MYDRQAFITTSYEVLDRSYTPLDLIDMDFEIEIDILVNTPSDEDSTCPCTGRKCFLRRR